MSAITPEDVLDRALWIPHMVCSRKMTGPGSRPGEVIERLSEEDRALLRKLESRHIATIRPDVVALWVEPPRRYRAAGT